MKSIRIYQPLLLSSGAHIALDKNACNHLLKVLRLKDGQSFLLFSGDGNEYPATLEVTGKKATAHLGEAIQVQCESPLEIHLYQGISKGERMDFAIQKSVELGVTSITPVFCQRTVVNLRGERLDKKCLHWKAVAISACEQSGRAVIPEIRAAISFSECLNSDAHNRIFLDPHSFTKLKQLEPDTGSFGILIGPEGGLTEDEILAAKQAGFIGVTMGPRILRTETAALASIAAVQNLWGDL